MPGKRLPTSLHLDTKFTRHVLGQERCIDIMRIDAKKFISECRTGGANASDEREHALLWSQYPSKIAPAIVSALGRKFSTPDLSAEARQCFEELTGLLPSLVEPRNWPTSSQLRVAWNPAQKNLKTDIYERIKASAKRVVSEPKQGRNGDSNKTYTDDSKKTKTSHYKPHVYLLLRRKGIETRIAGITEMEGFHVDSLAKLWEFFAALKEEAKRQDPIDRFKSKLKPDCQTTAIMNQVYAYGLAEGFPIVVINTGLFYLFLRTSFTTGESYFFCNYAPPYCRQSEPVALQDRGKVDSERQEEGAPWDLDLLSCFIAALLEGIDEAISMEPKERVEQAAAIWSKTSSNEMLGLAKSKQKSNEVKSAGRRQDPSRRSEDDDFSASNDEGGGDSESVLGNSGASDSASGKGAAGEGEQCGGGASSYGCGRSGICVNVTDPGSSWMSTSKRWPSSCSDPILLSGSLSTTPIVSRERSSGSTEDETSGKTSSCHGRHDRNKAVRHRDGQRRLLNKPRNYPGRSRLLITTAFCSEKCMQTLKQGLELDPECPNSSPHGFDDKSDHSQRHPITAEQVVRDIEDKLCEDGMWHIMEPTLCYRGYSAQLFRVVHRNLGYAFAAKRVNNLRTKSLQDEAAVYGHIWSSSEHRNRNTDDGMFGGYPLLATLSSERGCDDYASCRGSLDMGETRHSPVRIQVPISFGVVKLKKEQLNVMYPLWPFEDIPGTEEAKCCNTSPLLSYHGESLLDASTHERVLEKLKVLIPPPPMRPENLTHGQGDDNNRGVMEKEEAQGQVDAEWRNRNINVSRFRCASALEAVGVSHNDLYSRNLLWSDRHNSIFVIDYGHSETWTALEA